MGRRPEGLLGGMWEPVMLEGADAPEALVRRAFAERAGVDVEVAGAGVEVVHVFTHRRLSLTVFEVRAVTDPDRLRLRGDGSYTELALLDPDDRSVPFSRLAEKVVAAGRPTSAPARGGAQRAARLAAEPELPWPGERQT
jgi:adenine-specific DNA glycosylase